jgi:hypothetical protein
MFVKNVIYSLKRDYGVEGIVYKILSQELDLESGTQKLKLLNKRTKMVFLPTKVYHQDTYDPDKREVLIDDLGDFVIKINDYIILNKCRYNIIEISKYDGAYHLTVQADVRAEITSIFYPEIVDALVISQNVGVVI